MPAASTPRAAPTTRLAYRRRTTSTWRTAVAAAALRDVLPPSADVSVALNLHQVQAASERPEDLAAAEHVDLIANRVFLDPMFGSGYSDDLAATTEGLTDWSFVHPGDEAEIGAAWTPSA
jgi:beta-glucosidase